MCCVRAHNLCGERVFGVTSPHLKFRTSDVILHRGKFREAQRKEGQEGVCVLKRLTLDLPQMERRHCRRDNFAIFRS